MPEPQEIELKFECAPEDIGRILDAAPDGEDDTRELISVYFDTPDLDLQKAGAALRVRECKGQRVQTFKRGDGMAREEHEAPIPSDAPDPGLGPLPDLLPQGARSELKPAFHVRVTRRQRLVQFDGAEIELAVDQGEVRGGKRTSPISEVELELKSGRPTALFGLARELSHAAPLYLSFASKAQRGQALISGRPQQAHKAAKVELVADATIADAFQAIGRSMLQSITANAELLRRQSDAEGVHQLRVATRTLRSGLSNFKSVVTDERFEAVKEELRWLSKACDQARNLDVFAEDVVEPAAKGPAWPTGLAALKSEIEAARERAKSDVVQAVESTRFRDLMIEVTSWVDTGAWLSRPPSGELARDFAHEVLQKRRRKVVKRGKDLAGLDDAGRHKVRIEAKKLRYAAEGFQTLYGRKAADRFIKQLKDLQDELGELNDIVTGETLFKDLGLSADAAFAAGELVGRRAEHKPDHIAAGAKALEKLADTDPFWG